MSNWKELWVYGYRAALESWVEAKKVADEDGIKHLPSGIEVYGPVFPQEPDGVDDDGNPVYKRKKGSVKCLWMFALHGDKASLIDEVKVLNGPYTIIEDSDIDAVKAAYPDYCLGQGIPHLARIKE